MKIKKENKFLIFLFSIIVLSVYFSIDFQSLRSKINFIPDKILSNHKVIHFRDRVTYKTLQIEDCVVEYQQSKTNFKHLNYWTGQHGGSNEYYLKDASLEICDCICEKNLLSDKEAFNFVLNILKNDTLRLGWYYDGYLQENFFLSIDSIVKYKEMIFENDTFTLSLIGKYEITHDSILKKQILKPFLIDKPCSYYEGSILVDSEFIEIKNLLNLIEEINLLGICSVSDKVFFSFPII